MPKSLFVYVSQLKSPKAMNIIIKIEYVVFIYRNYRFVRYYGFSVIKRTISLDFV